MFSHSELHLHRTLLASYPLTIPVLSPNTAPCADSQFKYAAQCFDPARSVKSSPTVIIPCLARVKATFKRRPSAMKPTRPWALERTYRAQYTFFFGTISA
jgi:hypothetical protein